MWHWFLHGLADRAARHYGPHARPPARRAGHPWWQVMCLTGVDYFSSLGYQPAIAALAAGLLSPLATLVLVLVTLGGALPVYRRVARESPHGEGSIAILERLLPFWRGKISVLLLLGFAATDFVITMTLSTADATAHLAENRFTASLVGGHLVACTALLLGLLGGVFLAGFTEAIGIAVVVVAAYLLLNLVVIAASFAQVFTRPEVVIAWPHLLVAQYQDPLRMIAVAVLVFPKLALGLSGFETGVAVMPLIKGDDGDTEEQPVGRIRRTHLLLNTAALIMSVLLVCSSVVTTLLIPPGAFAPGGAANGRALAYLAHRELGDGFGTAYDFSTIAILWFAGASAMAGLLNLVPRYLPRYGMAPRWTRAVRPLVVIFTVIALVITVRFRADVDAQAGAYATGVLVLFISAAVTVALSARRAGQHRAAAGFGLISVIFIYTAAANVIQRPEGIQIATLFIGGILSVSLVSRVVRDFELRVTAIHLDPAAQHVVEDRAPEPLRVLAHEPGPGGAAEYRRKLNRARHVHNLANQHAVVFVEVTVKDPSDFETELRVTGHTPYGYPVLRLAGPSVPNSIAALLLHIRARTGTKPHVYFEWSEGNPFVNLLRYLIFGLGEVAPITREILREAEPEPRRRPIVHVA
jgi:hypothetical protein